MSIFSQLYINPFILISYLLRLEDYTLCLSKFPCQLASCHLQPMGDIGVRLTGKRKGEPFSSLSLFFPPQFLAVLCKVTVVLPAGTVECSSSYQQVVFQALVLDEVAQMQPHLRCIFNGTVTMVSGWQHTFVSSTLWEVAATFSYEFWNKLTSLFYSSRSFISSQPNPCIKFKLNRYLEFPLLDMN